MATNQAQELGQDAKLLSSRMAEEQVASCSHCLDPACLSLISRSTCNTNQKQKKQTQPSQFINTSVAPSRHMRFSTSP
ncbi:Uncharacterized protein HZ326_21188 [Fusarium oxysporum f. sp. albedinis]|nr:Uncharacterized protein HZ326_21188 [Fusarium oxysporum f. sp. albedinis]